MVVVVVAQYFAMLFDPELSDLSDRLIEGFH